MFTLVFTQNLVLPRAVTDDFSRQKIVWGEFSAYPKFALAECEHFFPNNMSMIISPNNNILLACLNSSLSMYHVANSSPYGMGSYKWYQIYVKEIPVVKPTDNIVHRMKPLVEELLTSTNPSIESEIDNLIFEAFGFNQDERKHIRSFTKYQ